MQCMKTCPAVLYVFASAAVNIHVGTEGLGRGNAGQRCTRLPFLSYSAAAGVSGAT